MKRIRTEILWSVGLRLWVEQCMDRYTPGLVHDEMKNKREQSQDPYII